MVRTARKDAEVVDELAHPRPVVVEAELQRHFLEVHRPAFDAPGVGDVAPDRVLESGGHHAVEAVAGDYRVPVIRRRVAVLDLLPVVGSPGPFDPGHVVAHLLEVLGNVVRDRDEVGVTDEPADGRVDAPDPLAVGLGVVGQRQLRQVPVADLLQREKRAQPVELAFGQHQHLVGGPGHELDMAQVPVEGFAADAGGRVHFRAGLAQPRLERPDVGQRGFDGFDQVGLRLARPRQQVAIPAHDAGRRLSAVRVAVSDAVGAGQVAQRQVGGFAPVSPLDQRLERRDEFAIVVGLRVGRAWHGRQQQQRQDGEQD